MVLTGIEAAMAFADDVPDTCGYFRQDSSGESKFVVFDYRDGKRQGIFSTEEACKRWLL